MYVFQALNIFHNLIYDFVNLLSAFYGEMNFETTLECVKYYVVVPIIIFYIHVCTWRTFQSTGDECVSKIGKFNNFQLEAFYVIHCIHHLILYSGLKIQIVKL